MAGQGKRKGGKGSPVGRGRGATPDGRLPDDRMWVCRGCCCGTKAKHPGVDHRGLDKQTRAGAERAGLRYELTGCLGACAQGNLVVVRREGRVRWYRRMLSQVETAELLNHLEHGAALPESFERHLMPGRDGMLPDPE